MEDVESNPPATPPRKSGLMRRGEASMIGVTHVRRCWSSFEAQRCVHPVKAGNDFGFGYSAQTFDQGCPTTMPGYSPYMTIYAQQWTYQTMIYLIEADWQRWCNVAGLAPFLIWLVRAGIENGGRGFDGRLNASVRCGGG